MSTFKKAALAIGLTLAATTVIAQPAKSLKHATKATELRQSLFQLIVNNMGPMGAMAKGKIPIDKDLIAKNAMRINHLSLMIPDYMATDTRKFKVETEALDKVWTDPALLAEKANALTLAAANLQKVVLTGNDMAIKKAIGGIGKTCGGCHDSFKAD